MRNISKVVLGLTAAGVLAATVAGCSSSKKADKKPVAEIKSLSGMSTSVKLDAGFVKAITGLGLAPGVVGGAKLDAATGTVSFPITGGNVTVYKKGEVKPYVKGSIKHDGSGLSLKAGPTTVQLENFDIDPGSHSTLYGDVSVNGKVAVKHAPLFDLDGSTLKPLTTSGNTATLTGTRVLISSAAADLLNKTFKTTAVKAGLVVGVATIVVNVK
ncbi:MAG: hypothetical protein DLM58_22380 [Pseudonocardiales bacterium]|nr:MAG: hypothetical protein DLM58_22380 [Pseudonocardiales bacterium]